MKNAESLVVHGEIPRGYTIMTSCDSVYLHAHGPAFISSCAKANNNVHIHIVNPKKADTELLKFLRMRAGVIAGNNFDMTISYEQTDLSNLNSESLRTYYACNRFLVAAEMMSLVKNNSFLITDVDCVIMKHIPEPSEQVGIFTRKSLPGTVGWEAEGTKVAAGVFYCKNNAKAFLQSVAKIILNNEYRWFLDQVAINFTYNQMKNDFTYTIFDNSMMDWEFIKESNIYSGKGELKHTNKRYLSIKKQFEDEIYASIASSTKA